MSSPYEFIPFGGPFDAPSQPSSATQSSSTTRPSPTVQPSPAARSSPPVHPSPAVNPSPTIHPSPTVQPSASSPVSEYHLRYYRGVVNGGNPGFNLDGQSNDKLESSQKTQSLDNPPNSTQNVSDSQQSSEAPVLSNDNSMGGKSASAPQSISSSTNASSFDPSLQSFLGTDFSSSVLSGACQTNSTYAGYSSDINVTPRASQAQVQGTPTQGNYSNPNGVPWTSPYVAQGGSCHVAPAHNDSRTILDGTSVYNSSQSERPTGRSANQAQIADIKSSTGNEYGAPISSNASTAPKVGLTLGVANPVLLPGYNNDYAINPIQDPGYTLSAEIREKLLSIDDRAPEYMPNMMEVYDVGNSGADTKTIFADCQEAHKFKDEQLLHDDTIPRTLEQQRAIVKMLCKAMKSLEYARDSENMLAPFRRGKFSDTRIEKVCWSIVQTCMYCHTKGFLLANYGYRAKQSSKIKTYAERMSIIVELLLLRKTICKHLLDPYYVYHVVDDPIHALKRVVSNKNLNNRKGRYMTIGKREAERLAALERAEELAKAKAKEGESGEKPSAPENGENAAPPENPEDPLSSSEDTEDEDESKDSSVTVSNSALPDPSTSHTKKAVRQQASAEVRQASVNGNGNDESNSNLDGEYEDDDDYNSDNYDYAEHEDKNNHDNDKANSKNSKSSKKKAKGNESKSKGKAKTKTNDKSKSKGKGKGKGKETKVNEANEPKGKTKAKGKETNKTKAAKKTDKTANKAKVSTEKSQPPSASSPIIGRKRGASELDEASTSKKRRLSSESVPSNNNDNVENNNQASKEQSPALSTVSAGSSRKRGASELSEASASKKKRS